MPFKIVRNDITKMNVDAIVNTANMAPIYSEGVDTAVYEAAGAKQLLEARRKIGVLKEGDVAITPGFNLPAKYIIHAVSPLYLDGESGEEELLRSCYQKSLQLADKNHCESIAFPLISTGGFGYPKEEGMRIALDEINAFLLGHEMMIYLVVFDDKSTQLGRNLYPDLEAYIDQNYVSEQEAYEYGWGNTRLAASIRIPEFLKGRPPVTEGSQRPPMIVPGVHFEDEEYDEDDEDDYDEDAAGVCRSLRAPIYKGDECIVSKSESLEERMLNMSYTFQEYLLEKIEEKGLTNAKVYNNAVVTKQLFSKIKLNPDYHPDKATVLRLCVGARLTLEESKELLARAGYALSPCDKRDIIFAYFLEKEVYDMVDIALKLEEYGLPCFIE